MGSILFGIKERKRERVKGKKRQKGERERETKKKERMLGAYSVLHLICEIMMMMMMSRRLNTMKD